MATDLATIGFRAETRELDRANKKLKGLAEQGGRTEKSARSMSKAFGAAGAVLGAITATLSFSAVARYADSWKNVESQLKQVTNSELELITVRRELLELSEQTRTDAESTVKLYATLDRATSRLGVTTQEQIDLTRTINNLFLASGATAEDASNAIRQLSQGLEAGALRGDEFNSVAENAPRIMDALGESLNMTRGELREFAATGGITAEIVVNALQSYSDEAQRAADLTVGTWAQSLVVAGNKMTEFAGKSRAINSVIGLTGEAVVGVSEILAENVEYAEAYFWRFGAWGEDVASTANIIGRSFNKVLGDTAKTYPEIAKNTETLINQITEGFSYLPDNLRAFIQIMGVELAYLVDLGGNYGTAFGEAIAADFNGLIDKAEIWGDQLYDALNPFDDSGRDFNAELKEVERKTKGTINSIFDKANSEAERSRQARLDVIGVVLRERQESIKTYKAQVKGIKDVETASANLNKVQSEFFENFQLTDSVPKWITETIPAIDELTEKTDEWAELTERQVDRIDSAFADVWMNVLDGADNAFDSLENSFKRMLAEMAHQALTRPIMLNIQQALSGGAGGIGGVLGGLGGGLGGAIGGIGNLLGGVGGLAGLGSSLGLFGGAFGASSAMLGAGQFGAATGFAGNLLGAGSLSGALGAALPIAGVAAIAGKVVSDVLGFNGDWKLAEQKVTVEIIGDDFSGEVTTREKKKKLFKNRYRESSESLADDAFDAMFEGLQESISSWADYLDIDSVTTETTEVFRDIGDGWSRGARIALEEVTTKSIQTLDEYLSGFDSSLSFDTKGMDEQQIQERISQWAQKVSETMINDVFGELLDGIQKEGESAASAINRIITSMELLEKNAEITGVYIRNLGDGVADAATNIAEAVGGVGSLGQLTNLYYSEFVSEANKHGMISKQLTSEFKDLNLELPLTRKGFQDLISGLDLTTESGQEMYASLLRLIPGLDQFYDSVEQRQELANRVAEEEAREAERLAQKSANLNIRLLEAQGKNEEALALARKLELEALDPSLRAIMQQIFAEQDLAKAREEARQELTKQLNESISDLEKARNKELSKIDELENAARQRYDSEVLDIERAYEAAEQARQQEIDTLNELYETLSSNLEFAKGKLEEARSAEIDDISKLKDAAAERHDDEIARIEQSKSELDRALQVELDALEQSKQSVTDKYDLERQAIEQNAQTQARLFDEQKAALSEQLSLAQSVANQYGSASRQFSAIEALEAARAGDFSKAQNISELGGGFLSATQQRIAEARRAFAVSEIGSLADAEASRLSSEFSGVEAQIAAYETGTQKQLEQLERNYQAQLASIDADKENLAEQTKALLGIDDSVLSLDDAIEQFKNGTDLNYEEQKEAAKNQLDSELEAYQEQIDTINAQTDALLDIDNSVMGLNEAIALFKQEQAELQALNYEQQIKQLENDTSNTELYNKQLEAAEQSLQNDLEAYAEQKEQLNSQIDAILGIDNSVLSLTEAINQYNAAKSALDNLELEQVTAQSEVQQEQYALQQEQEQTAKNQLDELKLISGGIIELINIPPRYEIPIIPPKEPMGADREMLNEMKAMRAEMQNNLKQVAESTTSTAISTRRLEQIEGAKAGAAA